MGAVRDIKSLTVDIREATGSSVLATEEASKRASSSADSARRIRYTIQQQQSGTQQVTQSMDEISEVIQRTVSASSQLAATASQLTALSERLQGQVEEFRLPTAKAAK
ncbi:MAG: hypothetical protein JRI25_08590 [Deltaproteobacteria bacterium]|nr:hypothetical protein [Deltaproteobacteria bacterium]